MTLAFRHAGRVDDKGNLHLRSVSAWRANIARLKGREVFVCIGRMSQPVTLDQHAYYRKIVLPLIAEDGGWDDRDELHYRLKEKHIPKDLWTERRIGAEVVRVPPSMADLTKEQASAFITDVITQATHAGINIPEPKRVLP